MASSGYFSVQRARPDGSFVEADCVFIQAASAIAAAEEVLGERLAPRGKANQTRAKVWYLADDFTPLSVTFYRQSPSELDRIEFRHDSLLPGLFNQYPQGIVGREKRSYDYGVLMITAICCLPVAVVAALVAVLAS